MSSSKSAVLRRSNLKIGVFRGPQMLKSGWRGIATRYAKNTALFLAVIHIKYIVL